MNVSDWSVLQSLTDFAVVTVRRILWAERNKRNIEP